MVDSTLASGLYFTFFEKNKGIINKNLGFNYIRDIKSKLSSIDIILNHFFRAGLKKKFLIILQKAVSHFYFNLFENIYLNKSVDPLVVLQAISSIEEENNFYNFKSVLNYYCELLEPIFYVYTQKINKKINKKIKKKYNLKTTYIRPAKRQSLVLKSLLMYSNLFEDYNLQKRLTRALLLTFIQQKSSLLYNRKLFMYSSFLKKINKNKI